MTASPPSAATPKAAPAALADAPPLAPAATPLCWVVDEDSSLRQFLSLVLHGAGVDVLEFADGATMRAEIGKRAPGLIFQNVSLESADAIEAVVALGKAGYRGALQLTSNRGAAVLDHIRNIGLSHKLNMLPVLKKPYGTDAILKIIADLKLGFANPLAARVDLDEALANNWVEFWYQPKIHLRKKQLAGVEAFARLRHPQHGVVMPAAFMPGAADADVAKLAERSIVSALQTQINLAELGIHIAFAVNIPLPAIPNIPIPDLIKTHRKPGEKWPGLIIDVTEQQILTDLAAAVELTKQLETNNVRLAVDDFGRGFSAMAQAKELPFAELKLDRSFVTDCGTDKVKAPLCKTAIDLAHNFGSTVVGVGIEKAADAVALVSMGCDYGQGFLLGQPMPEDRFVALLRRRSGGEALQKTPPAAQTVPA